MGYTLTIGEATVETDWDDLSTRMTVAAIDGEPLGAPIDSRGLQPPGHANETWPSYIAWNEAMMALGLHAVTRPSDYDGRAADPDAPPHRS